MKARVGILGGTFDPPHRAHVVMTEAALSTLGLDEVLWMPAVTPPHKQKEAVTEFAHRLRMSQLAVAGLDGVTVSDFERLRAGPSYTADMLESYRAETGHEVYFIVGADSLQDLPRWRDPRRILGNCTVVVFPRAGFHTYLDVPGDASVIVFDGPEIDVSSTDVRDGVERGEPVGDAIPAPVRAYIEAQSLYR